MRRFIALLILLVGLPLGAHAQWQNNGVPVSTEANIQLYPATASDGAGGAIIAWQDHRVGSTADIYVQRVSASGTPLWTAGGVALCTALNGQHSPTIVEDGFGGAIVAWQDHRTGVADIYAQKVNSAGVPQWTGGGVAVCTAIGAVFLPQIISDDVGGAIITWYDSRSGAGFDIYAQKINLDGLPKWPTDGVGLCVAAGHQYAPELVRDGAGGAIVTWYDWRSGLDTDIYVQRLDDSGIPKWTPNGVALCTAANDQGGQTIVSDGAAGAIVTWFDHRLGADGDIFARRVNAAGVPQWAADGVALCTVPEDQSFPTIAPDGAGGAIVVWSDYRNDGPADLFAQRVNATGTPLWTPGGVALCDAANDQVSQTMVADGAGGAIVTWNDQRVGVDDSDIYAQRIDASGAPQWWDNGAWICTAASYQFYPTLASDGAGGAIIAWFDDRDANYDIYAHHIGGSGEMVAVGPSRGPSLIVSGIYPNPFTGTASVDIELTAPSTVQIELFDVAGRAVRTWTYAETEGSRRVEFNDRDGSGRLLPSGVYFYRVKAAGETITRKMVIAR